MKNNLRRCQSCDTCKYGINFVDWDESDKYYCNLDGGYRKEGYSWNGEYWSCPDDNNKWRDANTVDDNMVCDDWEIYE